MKLLKITSLIVAMAAVISACQKVDYDNHSQGEGIEGGNFRILSPGTGTQLLLNAATPDQAVSITWSAAKPGIDKPLTYKWVAVARGQLISEHTYELPADNNGSATKLTVTHKQLDDLLAAKGVAANAAVELAWSIEASNGETKLISDDVFFITIKRLGDGATPFVLYGPSSAESIVELDPTATLDGVQFKWQQSKPASASKPVTYRIYFAEGKKDGNGQLIAPDFSKAIFSIASNNNGADSAWKGTGQQLYDSLKKYGYGDLSDTVKLQWTVTASSGNWQQWSDYTNQLYLQWKVSFFIAGSFLNNFDLNSAEELIVDKKSDRYSKVFYTYIKFAGGETFKFLKIKGDASTAYGNTGGSGSEFTTAMNQGNAFSIPAAGIYRLTIDVDQNKVYVQPKQVGVVGDMQGWDINLPIYGVYLKRDKFMIIAPSNGSQNFKFHDGNAWTFGVKEHRWWGGTTHAGELNHDGGDPGLVATASPYARLLWDGSNGQQLQYKVYQGKLRIVGGDASIGNWTPANALDMDYQGNGIWKKTVTFSGSVEFKFVIAEGWDLNYGDAGGGKIKENGGNLLRPAGTYTITVDEYQQTFTIL